ncbi:MAG: hypothetical protein H6740_01970 [Alphaproteobacteria bacterium]|nr:hypothetical protein [Alphaproteobacteria bacterium]
MPTRSANSLSTPAPEPRSERVGTHTPAFELGADFDEAVHAEPSFGLGVAPFAAGPEPELGFDVPPLPSGGLTPAPFSLHRMAAPRAPQAEAPRTPVPPPAKAAQSRRPAPAAPQAAQPAPPTEEAAPRAVRAPAPHAPRPAQDSRVKAEGSIPFSQRSLTEIQADAPPPTPNLAQRLAAAAAKPWSEDPSPGAAPRPWAEPAEQAELTDVDVTDVDVTDVDVTDVVAPARTPRPATPRRPAPRAEAARPATLVPELEAPGRSRHPSPAGTGGKPRRPERRRYLVPDLPDRARGHRERASARLQARTPARPEAPSADAPRRAGPHRHTTGLTPPRPSRPSRPA